MVNSTRRFVVCLSMCHFVLVFFSPFTSLGEERAYLSAFRTFVRFVLVLICRFPLPLGVWEGLRFVIVALQGLFSYLFFLKKNKKKKKKKKKTLICQSGGMYITCSDTIILICHNRVLMLLSQIYTNIYLLEPCHERYFLRLTIFDIHANCLLNDISFKQSISEKMFMKCQSVFSAKIKYVTNFCLLCPPRKW